MKKILFVAIVNIFFVSFIVNLYSDNFPSYMCPKGSNGQSLRCGYEFVDGLGRNFQDYIDVARANNIDSETLLNFLASAMMETKNMDPYSYPWGDNKRCDSFNAGAAKQNWYMIRTYSNKFKGYSCYMYYYADELNYNKATDIEVYKECQKNIKDLDLWLAGHRWGQQGIQVWKKYKRYGYNYLSQSEKTKINDIKNFKSAFEWTKSMIKILYPYIRYYNIRFWVYLPAI